MNLRNVDLNLLLAFDALMRERHVSRAAELMFISQSAMSHMLSRLRQMFDDPLFVRTSTGMRPTVLAKQLETPVRTILRDIDRVVSRRTTFDPSHAKQRFVIAANDYVDYFLLPLLMSAVEKNAPGIDLLFAPQDLFNLEAHMETGAVDLALGFEAILAPATALGKRSLFQDYMACLVRKDHPEIGDTLSLECFLTLNHLLVSSTGNETGLIDEVLSQRGQARRIALVMSHFLPAARVVATTDLILSLPLRLARQLAATERVRVVPVPLELPPYDLIMAWHPLRETDPGSVWLKTQIISASQLVADEPFE